MKKKKPFWKILLYILLVIIIVGMVVLPFVIEAAGGADGDSASVLSAEVTRRNIEKNISGTGTLTDEEAVEIELPYGVEITKYLVDNNDFVTEGTPLAEVDRVNVMTAIYEYQEDMTYVEEQMRLYTDNGASSFLTTASKGRVMEIYADVGDSISDVMLEHGALAVISLDGLLAVDAKGLDAYSVGSTLYVKATNGSVVPGRIESRKEDISVITLNQEGETSGDSVEILDGEFNVVSTGTLYVHSPLKISGYSGTVEAVHVKIDQDLVAGATVFTYTGNPATAEYGVYAARHRELEELTESLFRMYTDGTVNAPCAGVVTGIDEDKAAELELVAANGDEKPTLDFMVNRGDRPSVQTVAALEVGDTTTFPYYRAGVVTALHEELSNEGGITGYIIHTLTKERFATPKEAIAAAMTPDVDMGNNFPVNDKNLKFNKLSIGTVILFSYGENGEPIPSVVDSDIPGGATSDMSKLMGMLGGGMGGMSMGGMSSAAVPAHEYYSTKTTKPMSVIPQDKMTVDITVDELDILSIEKGQFALVTLDALAGQSFDGVITDIGVSGSNSGGNSKYTAQVSIDRAPNMIAGMNVTANITVAVKENVLTLPAEAICDEGTRSFVYLSYDEKNESFLGRADVTTGRSDGINVEILGGLSEGQRVWYTYYDKAPVSIDFSAASPPSLRGD